MDTVHAFYTPYKFWRTPIKWIKDFFCNCSIARDRIRKGWSPNDIWNLEMYLSSIIGESLDFLASHHMGYPGNEPFETSEKWEDWLRAQAYPFKHYLEDNDNENPFSEEFIKCLDIDTLDLISDELRKNYNETDRKIQEKKYQEVQKAMEELGKYWGHLWD